MDWIEWNGGACPVAPETLVEIEVETSARWEGAASDFSWAYIDDGANITAYRIVEEQPIANSNSI